MRFFIDDFAFNGALNLHPRSTSNCNSKAQLAAHSLKFVGQMARILKNQFNMRLYLYAYRLNRLHDLLVRLQSTCPPLRIY